MSEENKAIQRRIHQELFVQGNLAVADEVIAADFIEHQPFPGQPPGPEGVKQMAIMFRAAFPDIRITNEIMVAEGDYVADHLTWSGTHRGEFMGIAPTGKQVTVAMTEIVRIVRGKVVEHWETDDTLGLMQQLGVIPPQG